MMDQHIFENHYPSVEANEITLPKETVDRLKNMALKQDLKQGIRTLQCDVCSFKIRKKESRDIIRRTMDEHIFEKHYPSFEANEISLDRFLVYRLQKIARKRDRSKSQIKSTKDKNYQGRYQSRYQWLNRCQPTGCDMPTHIDAISGGESFVSEALQSKRNSSNVPQEKSQTDTIPSDTHGSTDKKTDMTTVAEYITKPKKKDGSIEEILSTNELFECPQCNLQFTNKNHLSRHINTGCVYKEGIKDWQVFDTEIQDVPISKSTKDHQSQTERKVTDLPKVETKEKRKPKKMPKLRKLVPKTNTVDDETIPKKQYKCQICYFTSYDLNEFIKHRKLPHEVYALGPQGIQYAGKTVCHQGTP